MFFRNMSITVYSIISMCFHLCISPLMDTLIMRSIYCIIRTSVYFHEIPHENTTSSVAGLGAPERVAFFLLDCHCLSIGFYRKISSNYVYIEVILQRYFLQLLDYKKPSRRITILAAVDSIQKAEAKNNKLT